MQIGHVELPLADPAASRSFYVEGLGLELVADQGGRFFWVRSGDVLLLLRPGPPRAAGEADETFNLVLHANDLASRVARLQAQGVALDLRGTCYYFQDPDGPWIQLVDPTADHSGG